MTSMHYVISSYITRVDMTELYLTSDTYYNIIGNVLRVVKFLQLISSLNILTVQRILCMIDWMPLPVRLISYYY